jgi:hypothetical protein
MWQAMHVSAGVALGARRRRENFRSIAEYFAAAGRAESTGRSNA